MANGSKGSRAQSILKSAVLCLFVIANGAVMANSKWDALIWDTDVWAKQNDIDADTIPDNIDNCPDHANAGQADMDGDGFGNACDADADGDGLSAYRERRFGTDPLNPDSDGDGVNDGDEFEASRDLRLQDLGWIVPILDLLMME